MPTEPESRNKTPSSAIFERIRGRKALTHSEIAKRGDVSVGTVRKASRGLPLTYASIRGVAKGLGISVEVLTGEAEENSQTVVNLICIASVDGNLTLVDDAAGFEAIWSKLERAVETYKLRRYPPRKGSILMPFGLSFAAADQLIIAYLGETNSEKQLLDSDNMQVKWVCFFPDLELSYEPIDGRVLQFLKDESSGSNEAPIRSIEIGASLARLLDRVTSNEKKPTPIREFIQIAAQRYLPRVRDVFALREFLWSRRMRIDYQKSSVVDRV